MPLCKMPIRKDALSTRRHSDRALAIGFRLWPCNVQMDWYLPSHYDKDGNSIEPRPKGDDVSEARLAAWKAGQVS